MREKGDCHFTIFVQLVIRSSDSHLPRGSLLSLGTRERVTVTLITLRLADALHLEPGVAVDDALVAEVKSTL